MKGFLKGVIAAVVVGCSTATVFAEETVTSSVTIPDIGVDIGGFISSAMTKIGPIMAIAIGATFAVIIVKWGISWARSVGSKRA